MKWYKICLIVISYGRVKDTGSSKDDCFIIFFSFQKTDAHTLTLFTKAKITRQALLIDIYL